MENQIYDRAQSHFLNNFPKGLPIEQAYIHIGIYLGWVIENHLYSDMFEDEGGHQIFRFTRREISCTILGELWDGYLGQEQFNDPGNRFTHFYYASGLYQKDYEELLTDNLPSFYHVKDTWDNYEKIKSRINDRFDNWHSKRLMYSR